WKSPFACPLPRAVRRWSAWSCKLTSAKPARESRQFTPIAEIQFAAIRVIRGRTSERVEIDEYLARARAVLGADDALVLHDFHDARGAVVADAQAALEHGGAGAAGRLEDVDRLLVELAIVAHLLVVPALVVAFFLGLRIAVD